jgi:hypothetical protein
MALMIVPLIYVWVLGSLFFIVRIVVAPFSSKVAGQMRKYPVIHALWGFFTVLLIWWAMNPDNWFADWMDHRDQQKKLAARVQSAGGWDAIRHGCIDLAEQNTNGFYSRWHDTNGLPAAVAALKPMLVEYQPELGCIRVRIFGMHRTGGHSTPYFGLEVDTSTNSAGYKHGTEYENGGAAGNYHSTYIQVAEGIYEIY